MPQTLSDFSAYLDSSERSSLTVKNYLADLRLFERWFSDTNQYSTFDPSDVTPTDLREYKQFLMTVRELKPASVNRHLASIRSFLKWAVDAGFARIVETSKIPKFERTEKTGIRWLDRREENAPLRAVERGGSARDAAVIKLLLNTGVRVSELCALRWSEIVINERKGILKVLRGSSNQAFEQIVNRLPINTGRFHRQMRASDTCQPVRKT